MNSQVKEEIRVPIISYEDVVIARQSVRKIMEKMGYSLIDQTKTITAVSELARNIVIHAGKGYMLVTIIQKNNRRGITCEFTDSGPGIADIEKSMQGGYSTVKSLGLGLSGSKKLSDEFSINTSIGKGTTVLITKWLSKT
jgi:serine/threonine-protein kinase RsbT